jgi:YebC/PmpR family DNA-binding regulatory protein
MTDNRNRTVGEIRHAFERSGGNMGTSGSVAWMFKKRGILHVLRDAVEEDRLMETALEAGAEDIREDEEVWTIETDPGVFLAVKDALERAGIAVENAEIDNLPESRVPLDAAKAESLSKLLGALEDLDDMQNVYANHEVSDEDAERFGL